jgi:methionine-rich copper-binding protein CopC
MTRRSGGGLAPSALALAVLALLLAPERVWAHAFVSRSDPSAGASLEGAPPQIRIWFDGPVEPLFIDIRVESGDKRRVDKRDARLSPRDNTLVEVGVPPLSLGRYRVFWSVIARDGHRREGNFSFLIK